MLTSNPSPFSKESYNNEFNSGLSSVRDYSSHKKEGWSPFDVDLDPSPFFGRNTPFNPAHIASSPVLSPFTKPAPLSKPSTLNATAIPFTKDRPAHPILTGGSFNLTRSQSIDFASKQSPETHLSPFNHDLKEYSSTFSKFEEDILNSLASLTVNSPEIKPTLVNDSLQPHSPGKNTSVSQGSSSDKNKPEEKDKNHVKSITLFKTEMCTTFVSTGHCRYNQKCRFAHGPNELRVIQRHPKYKTQLCKNYYENGSCPYGKRCCYLHRSPAELIGMPDFIASRGFGIHTDNFISQDNQMFDLASSIYGHQNALYQPQQFSLHPSLFDNSLQK